MYNPQQPSNLNSSGATPTTNYFNNYFTPDQTVSSNTNDAILSFFEQMTGNAESAKILSATVINTAQTQGEDPMNVLNQFQKMSANELTAVLALYLNTSRVNTSLLGIKNYPKTSTYVSRTVLW